MITGQESLLFFYGIFWAVNFGTINRFKLFSTHELFSKEKATKSFAARRLFIGFMLINFFPILWFIILYTYVVVDSSDVWSLMTGAFVSLSVFGINRMLHSFVLSDKFHSYFYSDTEWEEAIDKWLGTDADRNYDNLKCNKFHHHFLPGLILILMYPGIVIFLKIIV